LHKALDGQMVYYQYHDGRVCIVFPFMGKVIMGSTDIRVDDPDQAFCGEDELQYMLTTLREVFPGLTIRRQEIVYVYCGVRPLPAAEGVTANISRGHSLRIIEPDAGRPFALYCLIGGKWTTFRAFAEQVAHRIMARLAMARRCATEALPVGGGRGFPHEPREKEEWIARVAAASGSRPARVAALLARYGTSAETYLAGAQAGAEGPLTSLPEYASGEIRRIAAEEYVVHLVDLICRRSTIALLGRASKPVLEELAGIVGDALGWDQDRKAGEVQQALAEVRVP
jgi:glycerol-3-phosphate dehydrogenase